MKKFTLILLTFLLWLPLFAYDLADEDRVLIDSFGPMIQQIATDDYEKFESILDKLDVILVSFERDTRIYVVLEYLQEVMALSIPDQPTMVEELGIQDLMWELIDTDSEDWDDEPGEMSIVTVTIPDDTDDEELDEEVNIEDEDHEEEFSFEIEITSDGIQADEDFGIEPEEDTLDRDDFDDEDELDGEYYDVDSFDQDVERDNDNENSEEDEDDLADHEFGYNENIESYEYEWPDGDSVVEYNVSDLWFTFDDEPIDDDVDEESARAELEL